MNKPGEASEEKRVLVVDDNPIHRTLLTSYFQSKGYAVVEAATGSEAVEKATTETHTIILMDLLMPGLDGFETVKRIRNAGVSTPIIAQSSLSLKQDRDRCLRAGCNDFVPKPINFKELWECVQKLEETGNSRESAVSTTDTPETADTATYYDSPLEGKKVLLVEEDPDTAVKYSRVLENLGMKVMRVSNGNMALDKLGDPSVGMVVSNIFTSGIDGLGLLTLIKRRHPDTMMFLYTPEYDPETYQIAIRLGTNGILPERSFEESIANVMETAIYQSQGVFVNSRDADTAKQVRKSQARLNMYGFISECSNVDIAYANLSDAGGDIVLCRRFNLAGKYGLVLADVAGHDVMSSYISAIFMGIMTSTWDNVHEPNDILKAVNRELLKLQTSLYHVCVTAVLWENRRQRLKIATAGNPGGILIQQGENGPTYTELEGGGMCLGLLERTDLYEYTEIDFTEDTTLLLFSDGVERNMLLESARETEDMFGEGIEGVSSRLVNRLQERYQPEDDMVVVCIRGGSDAPGEGYHMTINSDYAEVNAGCEWLENLITDDTKPAGTDRDFIILAAREALLNAVEHGNKRDPGRHVDISVYPGSSTLRIDISDESAGFNLPAKLKESQEHAGLQIGKRGLAIMEAFTDTLEINGGTVSLTFNAKA